MQCTAERPTLSVIAIIATQQQSPALQLELYLERQLRLHFMNRFCVKKPEEEHRL